MTRDPRFRVTNQQLFTDFYLGQAILFHLKMVDLCDIILVSILVRSVRNWG